MGARDSGATEAVPNATPDPLAAAEPHIRAAVVEAIVDAVPDADPDEIRPAIERSLGFAVDQCAGQLVGVICQTLPAIGRYCAEQPSLIAELAIGAARPRRRRGMRRWWRWRCSP